MVWRHVSAPWPFWSIVYHCPMHEARARRDVWLDVLLGSGSERRRLGSSYPRWWTGVWYISAFGSVLLPRDFFFWLVFAMMFVQWRFPF